MGGARSGLSPKPLPRTRVPTPPSASQTPALVPLVKMGLEEAGGDMLTLAEGLYVGLVELFEHQTSAQRCGNPVQEIQPGHPPSTFRATYFLESKSAICRRRLKGRMSVQTSLI